MYRRLAILLVLQLILGACRERVSAEPARSSARAESEWGEVGGDERESVLERSDREFLPYAGKRVRRIRVRTLAVFGASVDDTTRSTTSGLARFLNRLSFRPRETTIRRHLLFKEGDAIDPYRLADSERILRSQAFLGDARILVVPLPGSADSADVLVTVKQTWTLTLSGHLKEGNRLNVRLAERDVLGLGHQLSAAVTLVPADTSRLGLDMRYAVPNILGSFINGELEYLNQPGRTSTGLVLSRKLIPHVLRYAGGLDLRRTAIDVEDSLATAADNTSDLIDLWAGRSVDLRLTQQVRERHRTLFVSGRVRRVKFTQRPPVTPATFYPYHDKIHYLGSLAFMQSRYYRTSLLYNFGRTEDIPCGFLARITCGLADQEFTQDVYASATLAAGGQSPRLGYGVGELRIGGYPRGGRIEQGVVRLRTLYFSGLLHVGGFRLRQFAKAECTAGIHRSLDDSIDFVGDEAIRGVVYNDVVTGSRRLLLNLETVAFTPWKAWGVSFAFFTFADLDIIRSGETTARAPEYYSGLGLGVRLSREAWGIGPLQLRFAWYPRLPVDHAAYAYTAFGETRFQPIEFLEAKPDIVEY
jgi:hypothetical protein